MFPCFGPERHPPRPSVTDTMLGKGGTMSADAANWAYAEDFVPEDTVLLAARDAADHLGCVPVLLALAARFSSLRPPLARTTRWRSAPAPAFRSSICCAA